jgi:hypothetical protein
MILSNCTHHLFIYHRSANHSITVTGVFNEYVNDAKYKDEVIDSCSSPWVTPSGKSYGTRTVSPACRNLPTQSSTIPQTDSRTGTACVCPAALTQIEDATNTTIKCRGTSGQTANSQQTATALYSFPSTSSNTPETRPPSSYT